MRIFIVLENDFVHKKAFKSYEEASKFIDEELKTYASKFNQETRDKYVRINSFKHSISLNGFHLSTFSIDELELS